MQKCVALAGVLAILIAGVAVAQLPPDAVQLDKVKISELQKSYELDPVTLEPANPDLGTFEHDGVVYGMSRADSQDVFKTDPAKYADQHDRARWEYNFTHAMSSIWCPVTDEISPGGNLQWSKIDLTWESCCQFCNDTVTDEDFPRALVRLKKRSAKAYELMGGAHYTEGASSPVAGAINLGGPMLIDDTPDAGGKRLSCEPAWVGEADLQPTFSGGIGKIMEQRCIECHRTGGLAPMALQTLGQVRKWKKNLRTNIETGAMPPWPAEPGYDFANGKRLTQKEKDVFLAWIDAGMPPGEGAYTAEKTPGEWTIGEPDKIIALEDYTIPENDADHLRTVNVDPGVDGDTWVTAAEIHADSFLVLEVNGGPLGAYHTGNSAIELPQGYGFRLKKGETVPVQVYYMKEKGWEEFDTTTQIGLKFAEDASTITKEVLAVPLSNTDFTIPAGADAFTATASFTFPVDGEIVSVNPVLRFRGASVSYVAKLPDGSSVDLLDIPRWDINYHFRYDLCEPTGVPAGTVVEVTATYDNSDMNAANPDSSVDVKAGLNGEMLEGWLYYALDRPTKSAENRFDLSDDELMAATGACSKCQKATGEAVQTD